MFNTSILIYYLYYLNYCDEIIVRIYANHSLYIIVFFE